MTITNEKLLKHPFLDEMYQDGYFPNFLVDKGKAILMRMCEKIEATKPASLKDLYAITHAATEEFNALQAEFWDNDSEIETAARDCIGVTFFTIAEAYGYKDADMEELIAPRDW